MVFDPSGIFSHPKWTEIQSDPDRLLKARDKLFDVYVASDPARRSAFDQQPPERQAALRDEFRKRIVAKYPDRFPGLGEEGSSLKLVGEAAAKGAGSAPFQLKAGVSSLVGAAVENVDQAFNNVRTNIKAAMSKWRYGDERPPSSGPTPDLLDKPKRFLERIAEGARMDTETQQEEGKSGILKPSTALEAAFQGDFTQSSAPLARLVYSASQSLAPNVVGAGVPAMTKTVSFLQMISEAAPGYWQARDNGLSPASAAAVTALKGAGTYKLEKLGLESIGGRNAAVRAAIDKLGANRVGHAAMSFAIEGGTEGLQQLWQNAVSMGYDGDVNAFQGVLESVLAGGLSGGVAGGIIGPRGADGEPAPKPGHVVNGNATLGPGMPREGDGVQPLEEADDGRPTVGSEKKSQVSGVKPADAQAQEQAIDLGDGVSVVASPDRSTWRMRTADGVDAELTWDDPDHAEILRVVDPDESARRVEAAVGEVSKTWNGPVKVRVVRRVDQLPTDVVDTVQQKAGSAQAEGAYVGTDDKGQATVYIVADTVSPGRAPVVALHEAVGHAGLRGVLGDRLEAVLDQVYAGRPKPQIEAVADRYGLDLSTQQGKREAAEEVLAEMAGMQETNPGMFSRAVAAIRDALRSLGVVGTWSDNDIAVLLGKSKEYVEGRRRGGAAGSGADQTRLSLPAEPSDMQLRSAAQRLSKLRTVRGSGQVKQVAKEFLNRPLANNYTDAVATVSGESLGKMMSAAAVARSVSPQAHMQAVGNIDNLFLDAVPSSERPSKKTPDTVKRVHHFAVPMVFGEDVLGVKIMVKEFVRPSQGRRIYLVRAVEIEKPATHRGEPELNRESVPAAGFDKTFSRLVQAVKSAQGGSSVRLSVGPQAAQNRQRMIEAAKRIAAKQGKKVSQFAERMAASDQVSDEDAGQIMGQATTWRTPQDLAAMKGDLAKATDAELTHALAAPRNDLASPEARTAGLALGELINRRLAAGAPISDLVDKGAELGRSLGQLLRQFGEIKSSTPAGVVMTIEEGVKKAGRALTPGQKKQLLELAKEDIDARQALRGAEALHESLFTDESARRVVQMERRAEKANRALLKFAQMATPKAWGDIFTTLLQGNLLTPMSQATNVSANVVTACLRTVDQSFAALADGLDTYLRNLFGRKASRSVLNPFVGSKEALKGAGVGLRKAMGEFVHGPDAVVGEPYSGFRPFTAFVQALTGRGLSVDPKTGKPVLVDRLKKFVESSFQGVHAEVMLRFLQFGDMPIREAVRRKTLVELGRIRGLDGDELRKFVEFPDEPSSVVSTKEAQESVFQQDNVLASMWNRMPTVVAERYRPVVRAAQRIVSPFTKTPTNLIVRGLEYAIPEWSLVRSLAHHVKGKRREAHLAFGRAMTGYMMAGVAQWLWERGLISGDPDKDEKMKQLQYVGVAPNCLNVSGLKRALNGDDPAWRAGDQIISTSKFGFPGLVLTLHANRGALENARLRKANRVDEISDATADQIGIGSVYGKTVLAMPLLKGMNGLLEALQDPFKTERWLVDTMGTMSAVAVPGTVAALSRASWQYVPERRGDTVLDSFINVYRARTFQQEGLPVKRGLFGERIESTPAGSHPVLYHMIDVTKARRIPDDPRFRAVADAFTATQNPDAIPSVGDRSPLKDPRTGKGRQLTALEWDRLDKYTGKLRGALVDRLIASPGWAKASPEMRVEALRKSYAMGREEAVKYFWMEKYRADLISPRQREMMSAGD